MRCEKTISGIDWVLLRKQYSILTKIIQIRGCLLNEEELEVLEGIENLIADLLTEMEKE